MQNRNSKVENGTSASLEQNGVLPAVSNSADRFIFETLIIEPIIDIVKKLEHDDFRDCDITWLNNKLKHFTTLAVKTLGKDFELGEVGSCVLNDYVKGRFLKYFRTVLDYFKMFD